MYGYDYGEKFEESWRALLVNYEVQENPWLQRLYSIKEKWASCYMKNAFTLGMRGTQLSESVNADIKFFINVNLDIIKFFKRFEDVVEAKRYNELRCEYEARQKIPRLKNSYSCILQQVSNLYTPAIFDIFQHEYELFEAYLVKSAKRNSSSIDYVIDMVKDLGEWRVSYDLDKKSISCSCRKFETHGILCCHCIRVFILMDVKLVPEQYILKRWTKFARNGIFPSDGVNHTEEDAHRTTTEWYGEICPRLIRIATEACRRPETSIFLRKVVGLLEKQIVEFQNKEVSTSEVDGFLSKVTEITNTKDSSTQAKEISNTKDSSTQAKEITNTKDSSRQAKGFKKKEGKKGSKRMKGQLGKRKKNGDSSSSQSQQVAYNQNVTAAQVQFEVPNTSTITWLNDGYNQQSLGSNDASRQLRINSFTSLLMAEAGEDITTLDNP
ncbi:protein FAR1-RELATED SEQUENCE 5-like [Lotus japonicus]|uniref:protein FAR1-RELATED SEQUENCE 5-like n=1 Tax=Lotus japonicus TaxID=34305 RepID=UPI00258FC24B|nr:protein FAR1-RELATED SEQUENCE 5-like [Lotus japonicus]